MTVMTRDNVEAAALQGGRYLVPNGREPRFAKDERVRTIAFNPAHHTRLPAYAKGKTGTVVAHRGSFVFPDSNAHGGGEQPQHLYSVRFDGRELWGDGQSGAQALHLDLWESYLEPCGS
ncbi:SH3-like domain-containing protein [Geminicoccus roseus]|uniref:SH3-like domain-containing protein n=1 Tax=Geminicoccus roseus TaxID=404900 RepID=UPI00040FD98F|nr:SH3-like domain-containing protein [Geminicoccus roseus]